MALGERDQLKAELAQVTEVSRHTRMLVHT